MKLTDNFVTGILPSRPRRENVLPTRRAPQIQALDQGVVKRMRPKVDLNANKPNPFRDAVFAALNGDVDLIEAHGRVPGQGIRDPEAERTYAEIVLRVAQERREAASAALRVRS